MIANRRDGAVQRHLRILFNLGTIGELTDGQLLERFATDPDEMAELAFSALVERHGTLVWRVCLAILRDEHDAEDAFQATFLVLLRKARSLWVQDSLGPWLHQVACRTATCLRASINRRLAHEQRCSARNAVRSLEIGAPRDPDRDAAIHEEVNRLPEKYRSPIVLCDLEGRTHREAARALGWPIGTVKSRQSHGRGLLRDRLSQRGVGLAVAAAVVESLKSSASAAIPTALSRSTVNGVMQQAGQLMTGCGVSSQVLTLTRGVLRVMFWIRIRSLSVVAVIFGLACGGASVYVSGSQEPSTGNEKAVSEQPATDPSKGSESNVSQKAAGASAPDVTRERLRAQQLATRKAKAHYEIARLTRELAELAVEEYDEIVYPRDVATVEGEIKLAESDVIRSKDRREWARRMFDKGYVSRAQKVSEEMTTKKALFTLEQAQSKRKVLIDYTRGKTLKELRSEVEKAHSDELAKKMNWELEKAKEADLERQLPSKAN